MNSTLDQAREFLLLLPESTSAEVLQAAQDRQTNLQSRSTDLKLPAVARTGAARQLGLLTPFLPVLEIEAELSVLEAAPARGPQIHQFRLNQKKLAERVLALPEGDERVILSERLAAVHQALQPEAIVAVTVTETLAPAPTSPSAPAVVPPTASALLEFTAKLAMILAEARALTSELRSDADRQRVIEEMDTVVHTVEGVIDACQDLPPRAWKPAITPLPMPRKEPKVSRAAMTCYSLAIACAGFLVIYAKTRLT